MTQSKREQVATDLKSALRQSVKRGKKHGWLIMIGLGVDTRRLRDGERLISLQKQVTWQRVHWSHGCYVSKCFAVHKIIEYADAYTLQNKLKLVTSSTKELGLCHWWSILQMRKEQDKHWAQQETYILKLVKILKTWDSMTDVSRITETFAKH